MEIAKTATKNVLFLFTADILSKIINFFYVVISARFLGVDDYGMLMFGMSFVEICGIGLDLGLSAILIREISKNESKMNSYFNNVLFIKIILILVTSLITGLILYFVNYGHDLNIIIVVLFITAIINSFALILTSVFQAFNKMQYVSIGRIVSTLVILIGAFFLIRIDVNANAVDFAFLYLASSIVLFLLSLLIYIFYFKAKIRFTFAKKHWLNIIKLALPFGISVIFVTIYYRIDSVMLKFFKGDSEVGLYNAAYNLIFALNFIQGIVITSIYPIMSKLFVSSREQLMKLFEISIRILAIFAFPIGVGTALLADRLILLIYGEKFIAASSSLRVLIWALVFMFLNVSIANLMNVVNLQKIVAYQIIIAAIFNIVANVFIIPKYGAAGASFTTVLSEILAFILLLCFSHKYNFKISRFTILSVLKIVVCTAIMGVFVYFVLNLNLFVVIILSAIVYSVLIYMFKVIDKNVIKLFLKLILNR
ncbi:MAG: flippase [Patescibacteria group bacterium]|jgi:O-antigen/teichoic acid export membrane protein